MKKIIINPTFNPTISKTLVMGPQPTPIRVQMQQHRDAQRRADDAYDERVRQSREYNSPLAKFKRMMF